AARSAGPGLGCPRQRELSAGRRLLRDVELDRFIGPGEEPVDLVTIAGRQSHLPPLLPRIHDPHSIVGCFVEAFVLCLDWRLIVSLGVVPPRTWEPRSRTERALWRHVKSRIILPARPTNEVRLSLRVSEVVIDPAGAQISSGCHRFQ